MFEYEELNEDEKRILREKLNINRMSRYYLEDNDIVIMGEKELLEYIYLDDIKKVKDALNFITENMNCTIQFYKGVAFSVEPPMFVELNIVECEPGIQGDTSKASYKPATLETGYVIQVPLFVNNGDRIRIDTRTGTYMTRV